MKKKQERIKSQKVNNEPMVIDAENYNPSVREILTWYRDHNITMDNQRLWIEEAANKLGLKERELIKRCPDSWIKDTVAFVSRMYTNELNLLEKNIEFLIHEIKVLIEKGRVSQERLENRVAPIERIKENVQSHIEVILERITSDFNFNIIDYVNSTSLSIAYVRQIVKSLQEDEGQNYEYINKLNEWIEENKTERKPRKKKEKSVEDILKLFNYCQEWESFKSFNPEKIIGSNGVVVYHTQKKKLQFYLGENLNVHRSMIIGFDETKSKEFHCTDKNVLTSCVRGGKLNITKIMKDLKDGEGVTGRITDKIILLGRY